MQKGEVLDAAGLEACLRALCDEHIALTLATAPDDARWQATQAQMPELAARQVLRRIVDDWRVTSYSGLQQRGHSVAQDLLPRLDIDAVGAAETLPELTLTPHNFPRGASPGTFLHSRFHPSGCWKSCKATALAKSGSRC